MELSRGFRWRPQQSSPSAGPPGPTVRRGRAGHCRAASLQLLGSPRSHPRFQMRKLQRGVTTLGSHSARGPERRCQVLGVVPRRPGPGHCEGSQRPLGSALALQEFSAPPDFGQERPRLAGSLPPAPGSYGADGCLPCARGAAVPGSAVHSPEHTCSPVSCALRPQPRASACSGPNPPPGGGGGRPAA